MLHLVLGSVHSGKSKYLFSIIKDLLAKDKKVCFVVPEQLSYETEKGLLDLLGVSDANRVLVLTFTKLCKTITDNVGGAYAEITDDTVKTLIMTSALQNLEGKLNYYKATKKSADFAHSMVMVVDEFKLNAVSYAQIEKAAASLSSDTLCSKMNDIALIYRTYDSFLHNSFIDQNDRISFCAEHLSETDVFDGSVMIFDAFDGFMPNQYKLFEKLLLKAEDIYVSLACNEPIFSDDDISATANVRAQARKLLATADKLGVKTAKTVELTDTDYSANELRHLELILSEETEETYDEDASAVTVVKARNHYDEIDFTAFEIKRLVAEEGYRYRDFAIVVRDTDEFSGALENAAEKYRLPVFFDNKHSLIHTPLFRLIMCALYLAEKINTDSVIELLKTGLLDFTSDEISELENYCYVWKIDGLKWLDEFKNNPNGIDMPKKDTEQRLEALNLTRERIVKMVYKFKADMGTTATDISRAVYKFIVENSVTDALKKLCAELKECNETESADCQAASYDKTVSMLNKIVKCDDGRNISISQYIQLFYACADGESVGIVPHNLDSVTYCSSDRARVNHAKVVFMLGVNQGKQPRLGPSGGLLTNNDRQLLISAGVEINDDLISATIDEKFKFYASACAASDKVYFCYSSFDFSMQGIEPSYVISAITTVFGKCRILSYSSAENSDFSSMYDAKPAFEKFALNHNSGKTEYQTAKKLFSVLPEYADELSRLDRKNVTDLSISPKNAARLYGNYLKVSASQIDTFHSCQFKYFCQYGLGVKSIHKAQFDSLSHGTLIHYFLEKFIKSHFDDYKNVDNAQLDREVDEIAAAYLHEFGLELEKLDEVMQYEFGEMKNSVRFILRDILKELDFTDFKPVECELKIGSNENLPLKIEFLGGTIDIIGTIDRLDTADIEGESYIRIIDYKSNSKKFYLSDVLCGRNVQMLLYLYSAAKNLPYNVGGALYKPVKRTTCDSKDTENNFTLASDGIVLRDENVFKAMDSSGMYVPLYYKTGKLKKSGFADSEEFEIIFKYIEGLIAEMGNKLHSGIISMVPVISKQSKSPCKYCDFKSICLNENEKLIKNAESYTDAETISIMKGE